MSDIKQLLDHPEKDKIIAKLVSGDDSPKEVSQWLKLKYTKDDENHLRLPATLLQEFVDKYLSQYQFLNKIVKDDKSSKLDKKVYESLVNNKAWRERLAEYADKEIDIKKKIQQILFMIETRAEQVFDKIQENPALFKADYVLLKYFEALLNAVEKVDKIVNERPEHLHQTNISIQMVEQHSTIFQDAIRELLMEMDPEFSARFLDNLNEKLSALQAPHKESYSTPEKRLAKLSKVLPASFEDETYDFSEEQAVDNG